MKEIDEIIEIDKIIKLKLLNCELKLNFAENSRKDLEDMLRNVVELKAIAQDLKDSIKSMYQDQDEQKLLTSETDACKWQVN